MRILLTRATGLIVQKQLPILLNKGNKDCIQKTKYRQVIYLSEIINEEVLSKQLTSRKNVERILGSGSYSITTLRAGIIIGSGILDRNEH